MEKIGIDVHKQSTQVRVLNADGEYQEARIRTTPAALDGFFAEVTGARATSSPEDHRALGQRSCRLSVAA